jgi:hypothetical protein
VIPLSCHFVDAIDIDRAEEMLLVNREVFGLAINLPRTGEYNLQLRTAVDVKIRKGILHGIGVTRLTCKVEEEFLSLDQVANTIFVPDIRNIDTHPVLNPVNVEQVASIFRDETVHKSNPGTKVHKPPGQIGSNEA